MHTLDILVTHYNEDSSIVNRFLDSLEALTYKDLQVTIVDDGLDCTPIEFSKFYSFKINHLKFPHKTVSKARNNALDNTSAKYLMFCDCDDMFNSNDRFSLNRIMNRILVNDLDIYRSQHYFEAWKSSTEKPLSALYSDYKDKDELILQGTSLINSSTIHAKIYKRDFIIKNNIRFLDDLYINEDGAFNGLAKDLCKIKNRKLFDDCEYFYIWKYNANSVTRSNDIYPILGYDQFIKSTLYVNRRCLCEINEMTDMQRQLHMTTEFNDNVLKFVFQGYYWLYLYSDKFIGKEKFDDCLNDDINMLKKFIAEFQNNINLEDLKNDNIKRYVNSYMSKLDKHYVENKLSFTDWYELLRK